MKRKKMDKNLYYKKKEEYEKAENELQLQKLKNRLKVSGFSYEEYKDLQDWKFLIFQYGNKNSKNIKMKVAKWLKNKHKDKPFLVLYGKKGTGKTTLAKKLLIHFFPYKSVKFLRKTQFDIDVLNFEKNNISEYLNELIDVGVLCIDDIGTGKDTDYKFSQLYTVLDARYIEEKLTILTTNQNLLNYDVDETKTTSQAKDLALLVDRLREKGEFVEFDYPSLRDEKVYNQAKKGRIILDKINKSF